MAGMRINLGVASIVAVFALLTAVSCGGGGNGHVSLDQPRASAPSSDDAVREIGLIKESEIATLPAWQQEQLNDAGWNQPYIQPRAATELSPPSIDELWELTREAVEQGAATVHRPSGASKTASWMMDPELPYFPQLDPALLPELGEYRDVLQTDPPPFGCNNDVSYGVDRGPYGIHALEDLIFEECKTGGAEDPPLQYPVSFAEQGLTRSNYFNTTGGSGNDALSAVYQVFSDTHPINDPDPLVPPEFAEISYRADRAPGIGDGGSCSGPAFRINQRYWKRFSGMFDCLPDKEQIPLYDIYVAPWSYLSGPRTSSTGSVARYQKFFFGTMGRLYHDWMDGQLTGALITGIESSVAGSPEYHAWLQSDVDNDQAIFVRPIYGLLLRRWIEATPPGGEGPWESWFGWPVFGPIAWDEGQQQYKDGYGSYYKWGMWFERGFMFWVDYDQNAYPNTPDEVQAFLYTGSHVYGHDGGIWEQLPTVYYGGDGPPPPYPGHPEDDLGVTVTIEHISLDGGLTWQDAQWFLQYYDDDGEIRIRDYYEIPLDEFGLGTVMVSMHAEGYGGVRNAEEEYKHYVWAFRDGTYQPASYAFDQEQAKAIHTYGSDTENLEGVYVVRVQVTDAAGNRAYGDAVPIHLGHRDGAGEFEEYEGTCEILSVQPFMWDDTHNRYVYSTRKTYTFDGTNNTGGNLVYPDQSSPNVYSNVNPGHGYVHTSSANNDWVNGNDVNFQFPSWYVYIHDPDDSLRYGVETGPYEEWHWETVYTEFGSYQIRVHDYWYYLNSGPEWSGDETYRGYAGIHLSGGNWNRVDPGRWQADPGFRPPSPPYHATMPGAKNYQDWEEDYVTPAEMGFKAAGYYTSTSSTELPQTATYGNAAPAERFNRHWPVLQEHGGMGFEVIAHWPYSHTYGGFSGIEEGSPYLIWSMYPGHKMIVPNVVPLQIIPESSPGGWQAYLDSYDIDDDVTVPGRSGTMIWNDPMFTFDRHEPETYGRVVKFDYSEIPGWDPDLNRDGTITDADKFPVRCRIMTNHHDYQYWLHDWPNHLQNPGSRPTSGLTDDGLFVEGGCYVVDEGPHGGGGPEPPEPPEPDVTWNIMVWMAGDNNLESNAFADIQEMERAVDDDLDNVNVYVGFDISQNHPGIFWPWYLGKTGFESDIRFIKVMHDEDDEAINISAPGNYSENRVGFNSADPEKIKDFVNWVVTTHDSDAFDTGSNTKNVLILWNHGNGWLPGKVYERSASGVLSDDTEGGGYATHNDSVREWLADWRFDILGFDACQMGNIETLFTYKDSADWIIASEVNEPANGYPYDDIILQLNTSYDILDISTFGRIIIDEYAEEYFWNIFQPQCISLFEMSQLNEFRYRFADLSEMISANAATEAEPYNDAVYMSRDIDRSPGDRDLVDFLAAYQETTSNVAIADRAELASNALCDFLDYTQTNLIYYFASGGVSAWLPNIESIVPDDFWTRYKDHYADDKIKWPTSTVTDWWETLSNLQSGSIWNYLVYIAADDPKINDECWNTIQDLEEIGSSREVTLLVGFDIASAGLPEGAENALPSFCKLGRNTDRSTINIFAFTDSLEVRGDILHPERYNSADPQNLADFVKWSYDNHPAQKTALILVGHGEGWYRGEDYERVVSGMLTDAHPLHGFTTNRSVADGIEEGLLFKDGIDDNERELEIVIMQPCLSGAAEVIYEFRLITDFVVASQYSAYSLPHQEIVNELRANTNWSGIELGKGVCDRHYDKWSGKDDQLSMAMYNVRNIDDGFRFDMSALSSALINNMSTEKWNLLSAALEIAGDDPIPYSGAGVADFRDYLELYLVKRDGDPDPDDIEGKVATVLEYIPTDYSDLYGNVNSAVVVYGVNKNNTKHNLSLWAPYVSVVGEIKGYNAPGVVFFGKHTQWGEVLRQMHDLPPFVY